MLIPVFPPFLSRRHEQVCAILWDFDNLVISDDLRSVGPPDEIGTMFLEVLFVPGADA
jgi:hypothetical protein